jgi:hypothetical protein
MAATECAGVRRRDGEGASLDTGHRRLDDRELDAERFLKCHGQPRSRRSGQDGVRVGGQSPDSDPTVSQGFQANSLIHKRALGSESRL